MFTFLMLSSNMVHYDTSKIWRLWRDFGTFSPTEVHTNKMQSSGSDPQPCFVGHYLAVLHVVSLLTSFSSEEHAYVMPGPQVYRCYPPSTVFPVFQQTYYLQNIPPSVWWTVSSVCCQGHLIELLIKRCKIPSQHLDKII